MNVWTTFICIRNGNYKIYAYNVREITRTLPHARALHMIANSIKSHVSFKWFSLGNRLIIRTIRYSINCFRYHFAAASLYYFAGTHRIYHEYFPARIYKTVQGFYNSSPVVARPMIVTCMMIKTRTFSVTL